MAHKYGTGPFTVVRRAAQSSVRHGAQLFFAGMHKKATCRRPPVQPPPVIAFSQREQPRRPVTHRQLVLFTMARDLSRGRGVVGPSRDPVLAAILDDVLTASAATHPHPATSSSARHPRPSRLATIKP
jgi:hypothetical protein